MLVTFSLVSRPPEAAYSQGFQNIYGFFSFSTGKQVAGPATTTKRWDPDWVDPALVAGQNKGHQPH